MLDFHVFIGNQGWIFFSYDDDKCQWAGLNAEVSQATVYVIMLLLISCFISHERFYDSLPAQAKDERPEIAYSHKFRLLDK